jgi:hypothetical protein
LGGGTRVQLERLRTFRATVFGRAGLVPALEGTNWIYRIQAGGSVDAGLSLDTSGLWTPHGAVNLQAYSLELSGETELHRKRLHDPSLRVGAIFQPGMPTPGETVEGRPFRHDGKAVLPEVVLLGVRSESPEGQRWLTSAREEHAAVASFRRLAQELTALGAPRRLVGRVLEAATDEVRHATWCYQRAAHLLGVVLVPQGLEARPRPITSRTKFLRALAHESMTDGFLNEGRAADALAARRDREADPAVAMLLHRIAVDERQHAQLGLDVARWCAEG